MRYLTLAEVLDLHHRIIEQSGGASGVRNLGGVESAVAQPQMHSAVTNSIQPSSPKQPRCVSRLL